MSDARDVIAKVVHDQDTGTCCDECSISSPGPWDYEVADAVLAALGANGLVVVAKGLGRYIKLDGDMDGWFMCRECKIGDRLLVLDGIDIHDRWHAMKESKETP